MAERSEEQPEPDAREETEAAEAVELDLDSLVADTRRERDEYLELAQRTKADFENYRKRMAAETKAAAARGKAELAAGLVSVIDNLERALTSAQIDPGAALEGKAEVDGPLEQGIVLTFRELNSTISRAGVEAFDPAGEAFDPNWHEAIQTRPVDNTTSGEVVETLQKGYRLDGQILRPARVVVSE
jgi:molecular chaperone GrpE